MCNIAKPSKRNSSRAVWSSDDWLAENTGPIPTNGDAEGAETKGDADDKVGVLFNCLNVIISYGARPPLSINIQQIHKRAIILLVHQEPG